MKIEFKVSKLSNLFFFVSNLSEWHFSCRPAYNQEWVKETGPLNKKEINALNEFKKIIKKYGFFYDKKNKSKYLGKIFYFYAENEIWKQLEKTVNKKEFSKIKDIFEILTPRFQKIWDARALKSRIKTIEKSFSSSNYQKALKDFENILGNKSVNKINIIALFSPLKGEGMTAAGGANIGKNNVTLEIPKLKRNTWEFDYSVGVIMHEIGHNLIPLSTKNIIKKTLKKSGLLKNIKQFPEQSINSFIEELALNCFVPGGCLAQKYFKKFKPIDFFKENQDRIYKNLENFKENKNYSLYKIYQYFSFKLLSLSTSYLKANKKIDAHFINQIAMELFKSLK